jgi:Ca-activated chloride channel homolog
MKIKKAVSFFIILITVLSHGFAWAQSSVKQEEPPTRILFLFDASQSMFASWQSGMRIDVAKRLMSDLLDSLNNVPNLELALRVFGHQKRFPPQDCDDTKLEVPFNKNNAANVKRRLNEVVPRGTTPIALSLEASAKDFPSSPGRNIIILITDGIEECQGDPCAVSLALQKKGIVLKPFVIGMGLDESFRKTFECVGSFYDATNEQTFKTALNVVISQALNNTTLQVNLLDAALRPSETNVAMTFYDSLSGEVKYNFIHTINSRGNPDTLIIDPLPSYKIVVHTIPPVQKEGVRLNPGKHNIAAIDAAQGYLRLRVDGVPESRKIQCILRSKGKMKTLHVQDFNTTTKYLTGTYDLEVLTNPRMYISDVDISQSKTTTVQIPQPGLVTFTSNAAGYGSILLEEGDELKSVYNLNENYTKETVVLQPGSYRVVYRPKNSRETIYTIVRHFRIISGSSIIVSIN